MQPSFSPHTKAGGFGSSSYSGPGFLPSARPPGLHHLAEIKYPVILDEISLDKILAVLVKIRSTTKPLVFKWTRIDRPKNGELYLEHKYPLSESLNEFPVIDDGYCWSSKGSSEVRGWQGQQIEVTHWNEGFATGERVFTMMKTEYRLYLPQNTLFLVHYRSIKQSSTAVRFPIIPSEKPAQSKPSNPPANAAAKKAVSTAAKPASFGKTSSPTAPLGLSNPAAAPSEASESPMLDLLDSWDGFEAAVYRFSLTKSALFKISHSHPTRQDASCKNDMSELESELTAALRIKLDDLQKKIADNTQSFGEASKRLEEERAEFWSHVARIEESLDVEDLTEIRRAFLESQHSRYQPDSATDASFIRL